MKYYVIWPDGQKFGPADVDILNQWVSEGRVTRDTELEAVDSGARLRAGDLPGLLFPMEAAAPEAEASAGSPNVSSIGTPSSYAPPETQSSGPVGTPYGSPQTPYQSPYQNPYQNPPQGYITGDDGSKDVTYSFVCSILGFFCCCLLTVFGAYMGNRAKQKGHPNGNAAFITAIVLLALQAVISVVYIIIVFPTLAAKGM